MGNRTKLSTKFINEGLSALEDNGAPSGRPNAIYTACLRASHSSTTSYITAATAPLLPSSLQTLTEVELPHFALASVGGLWDWWRRGRLTALWPLGGRGVIVILRKKTLITAGVS